MMRFSDWMTLLRLGRQRLTSGDAYVRFQTFQGEMILSEIEATGVRLEGRRALDLGCGYGGYSLALRKRTDRVLAADRHFPPGSCTTHATIWWVEADAVSLPFGDGEFDFIMCASLIEHVAEPLRLLSEIRRVMSPRGICYLSFPPFYSPVGGHNFKPYHLLGEKLAIRLSGLQCASYATAFGKWGLYPLTIRKVRRLVGTAGLRIRNLATRFLPLNTAALPMVGEFLTWHVQFLLARDSSSS